MTDAERILVVTDAGGAKCRGLSSLGRDVLDRICADPESLLSDERVRFWCKRGGNREVAAIRFPTADGEVPAYCKRIRPQGRWEWLRRLGRWPRARHVWERGQAFLRRGLCTPPPLLCVETGRRATRCEYVVTAELPRTVLLATWERETLPAMDARGRERWLLEFVRLLAKQVRLMHACGFEHRDLQFANLLTSDDPDRCGVWFLDLDDVRKWPWLPGQRVVRNLARIHLDSLSSPAVRRTHRLRFLRTYLGDRFGREWKPLWRAADRCAARIIRRRR